MRGQVGHIQLIVVLAPVFCYHFTCGFLCVFLIFFSSLGPRLVLHTPCGVVQWKSVVGEEFSCQHSGKIEDTVGPRFFSLGAYTPSICFDEDKSDVSIRPKIFE